MAQLEIRDSVIWLRHLEDGALRERLVALPAATRVALEIDGIVLDFAKMADGADGRPTQGLKPVGLSRQRWTEFWPKRKGAVVAAREAAAHHAGEDRPQPTTALATNQLGARASIAWIERELADIPYSDLDSVALLDAVRQGSAG
jgi:hypothetical protein